MSLKRLYLPGFLNSGTLIQKVSGRITSFTLIDPLIFIDYEAGSGKTLDLTNLDSWDETSKTQLQQIEQLDLEVLVHISCIGAGGSGGACRGAGGGGVARNASGGGGGGCATFSKWVKVSEITGTYTVGVGGLNPVANTGDHISNGGAGSGSNFSGMGYSLTANGGGGGTASFGSSGGTAATSGGSGGSATGGDDNYSGGSGGSLDTQSTLLRASGGGGCANRLGSGGSGSLSTGDTGATGGGGGTQQSKSSTSVTTFGGGGGFVSGNGKNASGQGTLSSGGVGNNYLPLDDAYFLTLFDSVGNITTTTLSRGLGSGGGGSSITTPSTGNNFPVSTYTRGGDGCLIVEIVDVRVPLIYGVEIDETNENPETAVTYIDDAVGMTPATRTTNGDWGTTGGDNELFKDIKPCLFKDGEVNYYLDPNDYTKKADGVTASILTGADGDVMLEIPKMYYSVSRSGTTLTVKVSRTPFTNGKAYAHTRTTEGDRDFLYVGAYLGTTVSSSLRSISGTSEPTGNKTIGTFRTEAKNKTNNGTGEYDQMSFYPLTLLQCLYLIRYKNLDSQIALGRGHVESGGYAATGRTNTLGMYAGTTSGDPGYVKFAGIEDFYGNKYYWIDGLFNNSSRQVLTAFKSFNDTGSGYMNQGVRSSTNLNGFMKIPQGDSECGFIPKEVGSPASASTYYCDVADLFAARLVRFGGDRGRASEAGAFFLRVDYSSTDSGVFISSRLMYL